MAPIFRSSTEYELLPRSSSDLELDHEPRASPKSYPRVCRQAPFWLRLLLRPARRVLHLISPGDRAGTHRALVCALSWILVATPCVVLLLVVFTAAFRPSYTHPPGHYKALEKSCRQSQEPGRGNINNEKVFIAATLYDANGLLAGGYWGSAIRELVQLLGPGNVHLSVYENDPDPPAKKALQVLGEQLDCNASLVSEHLPLEDFPRVTLPTGETRIKRMAFLSDVRNRALRPLQINPSTRFDKLLFVNDVVFRPMDAVHLLFSTNADPSGHAQYDAACAVDFINPFKFYDRFATRDLEGYAMGIPFFPWFTDAGQAVSRQDVLNQKDAVRVRACWGGMVAFDATWFQSNHLQSTAKNAPPDGNFTDSEILPLRFRYEPDLFWDASECCLIHADLTYVRHGRKITTDSGIFTNPYVRVAYDSSTLGWLPFTRRVERLYPFIHNVLNHIAGLPVYNPRRLEQPWDEVEETVWDYDGSMEMPKGSYHQVTRTVGPGRFCGSRTLQVLKDDAKEGEKKWMVVSPPPVTV